MNEMTKKSVSHENKTWFCALYWKKNEVLKSTWLIDAKVLKHSYIYNV